MYKREFDELLKKSLPQALLLYGDNEYLIDYYISLYIDKLNAKESMLKLYYDEYDFNQAKEYLSQSSLFGGINLLLIRHDKKIPKRELDTLVDLTKKNQTNYFIFAFYGDAKDAKSLQGSFKSEAVWLRLFPSSFKEARSLLYQECQKYKLDIDDYALTHLFTTLEGNLSLCVKEIEKLSILERKITTKDIDMMVYSSAPLSIERLLIELFNKKPIISTISKLLELGEDEFSIFRATQAFIQQIFLFQAYIKINARANSKEILGYKLPRQIEEQRASLAIKTKSSTLLKIYEHLIASELKLKRAKATEREALLYGVMIKLQSYL